MCSVQKKKKAKPEWYAAVKKYSKPDLGRSVWQIVNTLVPYIAMWALMLYYHDKNLWVTSGAALLAGFLVVRIFIIFHDCGHYSYFKSKRANQIVGYFTGVISFSPFHDWGKDHKLHHATSGNLDKRGFGDIWTLTVEEFRNETPKERLKYKLYRTPIVMLFVGPILVFLLKQRFVRKHTGKDGARSVHLCNLGLLVYGAGMTAIFGWEFLVIQGIVMSTAAVIGVWMFYVQHQFEETYWAHHEDWTLVESALEGSSFYKIPQPFQWLTGNIGFHHIHHLSSKIPNYKLEEAYNDSVIFQEVEPLTFVKSLKLIGFRLWDEKNKKMVGYKALKELEPDPVEEEPVIAEPAKVS